MLTAFLNYLHLLLGLQPQFSFIHISLHHWVVCRAPRVACGIWSCSFKRRNQVLIPLGQAIATLQQLGLDHFTSLSLCGVNSCVTKAEVQRNATEMTLV